MEPKSGCWILGAWQGGQRETTVSGDTTRKSAPLLDPHHSLFLHIFTPDSFRAQSVPNGYTFT